MSETPEAALRKLYDEWQEARPFGQMVPPFEAFTAGYHAALAAPYAPRLKLEDLEHDLSQLVALGMAEGVNRKGGNIEQAQEYLDAANELQKSAVERIWNAVCDAAPSVAPPQPVAWRWRVHFQGDKEQWRYGENLPDYSYLEGSSEFRVESERLTVAAPPQEPAAPVGVRDAIYYAIRKIKKGSFTTSEQTEFRETMERWLDAAPAAQSTKDCETCGREVIDYTAAPPAQGTEPFVCPTHRENPCPCVRAAAPSQGQPTAANWSPFGGYGFDPRFSNQPAAPQPETREQVPGFGWPDSLEIKGPFVPGGRASAPEGDAP